MLGTKLPENWLPLTIALVIMTVSAMLVTLNLGPEPEETVDSGGPHGPQRQDSLTIPLLGEGAIGEETDRNHLTIRARLRPAHPVEGQEPEAGSTRLEVLVYAEAGNLQSLPPGSLVPYLQLSYRIEPPQGGPAIEEGALKPTVARGGLHYGAAIHPAAGRYRLIVRVAPPPANAVARFTDGTAGVTDWWEPFTLAFPGDFPSRAEPSP